MSKERILRTFISAAGIVSAVVFITTKSETLMEFATRRMYDDGDLYRFAKVHAFKTALPERVCGEGDEPDLDPDTASIVIIGDSFMETCRGHAPFPEGLATRSGRSVYPVYAGLQPDYFDPVYFCWRNDFDPARRRIIVLERIERYIVEQFGSHRSESVVAFKRIAAGQEPSVRSVIRRRWFTDAEKNYEIFLTSSDITSPLIELWNTLRFAVLGQISDETPVYSTHPPFLFEKEEVEAASPTSYYYPHTDSLIASVAGNIAATARLLRERYGAELVFMPIPNPYTLYHSFVNDDPYDNFLPRLCNQLEKRGVRTVQLYQKFRKAPFPLYFPTDTHWNADGAALALDETMKVLGAGGSARRLAARTDPLKRSHPVSDSRRPGKHAARNARLGSG